MDKSTQDTDNENERKKFKRDRLSRSPSRVLHLHQVASDATEEEVISLGHPFGKVTNLLMLKGRNQALLEMASEEVAIAMVNYYALAIPHIRGQPVYIQYSHYSELKTDNLPDQARAQAALKAQNTAQPGVVAVRRAIAAEGGLVPCQGSVLRIVVENLFYFVGLEVLHQIFSKFGLVLKIVTFSRNNQFQALLEYGDPMNAYRAKMALDGQSIYSGCCTLRIDFSKISRLKVKYNNEKSRDFTRFDLPPGDSESFMEPSIRAAFGPQNIIIPSYAGFVPTVGFVQGAGLSVPAVAGVHDPFTVTACAASGQTTIPYVTGAPENSVLLVSNLNPEAITPHGLFILFGVYGDVHRVKIMFKRKENALVQMADARQAQIAITYLNGQKLYGRALCATYSKYQTVQLPRDGQEDQGLTKDYSNSPFHRFKNPGSRNFQNICPPSATLHLSSIPPSVTVDVLQNLFRSTGFTVKAFRLFPRDCTMALVRLGSVEEAIHALIMLHNHDLGENHYLRISFSKSII